MKICVLLPVYNEERQLADVLKGIKSVVDDVIVVDDGSSDDTCVIAESFGARVIKHGKNLGKGAALKTGFDYVLKGDWDAVITMDGDGQHDFKEIESFIRNAGSADILIGNRMPKRGRMPVVRYLTNLLTSKLISWAAGQEIEDSQCGFRLIKRDVIKNIDLKTNNFDTESEILIAACDKKHKIRSIPITTIYKEEKSKIKPLRDTFLFIKLMIASRFFG